MATAATVGAGACACAWDYWRDLRVEADRLAALDLQRWREGLRADLDDADRAEVLAAWRRILCDLSYAPPSAGASSVAGAIGGAAARG